MSEHGSAGENDQCIMRIQLTAIAAMSFEDDDVTPVDSLLNVFRLENMIYYEADSIHLPVYLIYRLSKSSLYVFRFIRNIYIHIFGSNIPYVC